MYDVITVRCISMYARVCHVYYCAFQRTTMCMYTYLYIHIYILHCAFYIDASDNARKTPKNAKIFFFFFFVYTHLTAFVSRLRVSNFWSHIVFSRTSFSRLVRRTFFFYYSNCDHTRQSIFYFFYRRHSLFVPRNLKRHLIPIDYIFLSLFLSLFSIIWTTGVDGQHGAWCLSSIRD